LCLSATWISHSSNINAITGATYVNNTSDKCLSLTKLNKNFRLFNKVILAKSGTSNLDKMYPLLYIINSTPIANRAVNAKSGFAIQTVNHKNNLNKNHLSYNY